DADGPPSSAGGPSCISDVVSSASDDGLELLVGDLAIAAVVDRLDHSVGPHAAGDAIADVRIVEQLYELLAVDALVVAALAGVVPERSGVVVTEAPTNEVGDLADQLSLLTIVRHLFSSFCRSLV